MSGRRPLLEVANIKKGAEMTERLGLFDQQTAYDRRARKQKRAAQDSGAQRSESNELETTHGGNGQNRHSQPQTKSEIARMFLGTLKKHPPIVLRDDR
jgi:hypothetical protein